MKGLERLPIWRVPDLADEVCDLRTLRTVGELIADDKAG
jgi:hypothetical protein